MDGGAGVLLHVIPLVPSPLEVSTWDSSCWSFVTSNSCNNLCALQRPLNSGRRGNYSMFWADQLHNWIFHYVHSKKKYKKNQKKTKNKQKSIELLFSHFSYKKGKRGEKAYTCLRLENYPFSKIVRTIHKTPPTPLRWIIEFHHVTLGCQLVVEKLLGLVFACTYNL